MKYRILIIDDDSNVCLNFQNLIDMKDNFSLIGITNNSNEALQLTKEH